MSGHRGEDVTATVREREHDPDRVWGVDGWVRHEGCPAAVIAGQTVATHSKAYHRRGTLPGVLHADRREASNGR